MLLQGKDVLVEVVLQLLVGKVDVELLETINLQSRNNHETRKEKKVPNLHSAGKRENRLKNIVTSVESTCMCVSRHWKNLPSPGMK